MRRFATIIAVLVALTVTGSAFAADYGWNLSGSNTDPDVNTGPALAATPFPVYLWLNCTNFDGMAAAEFSLQSTFFNAGFTPMGGALNAGDGINLLLAVGACPVAGSILGSWNFLDFTGLGGAACLGDSPGGVNGTVDCDVVSPLVHDNAVVGYTTDGSMPCAVDLCTTVSVEAQSWGGVKSLYR